MLHPLLDDRGKNKEPESGSTATARASGRSRRIASSSPPRLGARCREVKPGLRRSPSISTARAPRWASSEAKFLATVDLPSLGSAEMTPMTFGLRVAKRQIDRDLGRAQRLGEARERMVDRIALQRIGDMDLPGIPDLAFGALDDRRRFDRLAACRGIRGRVRRERAAAMRNTRSRYSRNAPRPAPTIAPITSDSARMRLRLG